MIDLILILSLISSQSAMTQPCTIAHRLFSYNLKVLHAHACTLRLNAFGFVVVRLNAFLGTRKTQSASKL